MSKLFAALIALIASIPLAPVTLPPAPADACPPTWTYQKQSEWGGACEAGKMQSPVDVGPAVAKSTLTPIAFDYRAFPMSVMNTSRVFEVPHAARCSISANHTRYNLQQFHFHFPSEHRVNGNAYDGELHLVHAGPDNRLAVVGIFIERGAANATLAPIVNQAKSVAACRTSPVRGTIDPAALAGGVHDYATYSGSLTTPPCSETVTWYVMTTPIAASEDQITVLKSIGPNNRMPPLPLNGRALELFGQSPK